MEKYKLMYGKLPLKTPADAGYGRYDNYMYCRENGIGLFMKYPRRQMVKIDSELLILREQKMADIYVQLVMSLR